MIQLWKKERPAEANVRRNDFSRDSTLSQNICFFQETEPNARIRFTVTASIGFSLIALSTET